VIEGIAVSIDKGGVQEAIDAAGASYHEKYGIPPTHVCLPGHIDRTGLNLYTLTLGTSTRQGRTQTRHTGTVIVGRESDGTGSGSGYRQMDLF